MRASRELIFLNFSPLHGSVLITPPPPPPHPPINITHDGLRYDQQWVTVYKKFIFALDLGNSLNIFFTFHSFVVSL